MRHTSSCLFACILLQL